MKTLIEHPSRAWASRWGVTTKATEGARELKVKAVLGGRVGVSVTKTQVLWLRLGIDVHWTQEEAVAKIAHLRAQRVKHLRASAKKLEEAPIKIITLGD